MKQKKRVFLIVLDSFGIGAAPDACDFGDCKANTLGSLMRSDLLKIPNMKRLGLFNIDGVKGTQKEEKPHGIYGRMIEKSCGKDTTIGHFELMGIKSDTPLPTYPNGFPEEIIEKFKKATGKGVLCNKPYSGTEVIRDYGEEHLQSGDLIVYTSADSVFQIAAHEQILPPDKLYEICQKAREILVGEHGVGRVIARPFIGKPGEFMRTANRRDFSIAPPRETALDKIKEAGLDVIAVGKITDIFATRGITESIFTHSNDEGIEQTLCLLGKDFTGLAFINLVDFDMLYGHRQDINGYARALSEFDSALPHIIRAMKNTDLLIITADHGCDPGDDSTDHTREYVPLLIYSKNLKSGSLGTLEGFGTVGQLVCDSLSVEFTSECGERIYSKI